MDAVALRKESVDRNILSKSAIVDLLTSLSARRAWIEIILLTTGRGRLAVALRKESVDRNNFCAVSIILQMVALRKESVDRNCIFYVISDSVDCRSPQGERG